MTSLNQWSLGILDFDEQKADEDKELANKTYDLSCIFFDANMYRKVLSDNYVSDDRECQSVTKSFLNIWKTEEPVVLDGPVKDGPERSQKNSQTIHH